MSALHGSMTYTRFFATLSGEPMSMAALTKSINSRFFVAPTPGGEASEGVGWVPFEDPHNDGEIAEMSSEHWQMGTLIALAYREDQWKLPRPLVKRETARIVKKHIEDTGASWDDIGRAFVKACQRAAEQNLRGKIPPRTRIVDVVWDEKRGEVRIYGKGAVVHERVAALVERTFGLRLDAATPAGRAIRSVTGDETKQRALGRLSPAWLFPDVAIIRDNNTIEAES